MEDGVKDKIWGFSAALSLMFSCQGMGIEKQIETCQEMHQNEEKCPGSFYWCIECDRS